MFKNLGGGREIHRIYEPISDAEGNINMLTIEFTDNDGSLEEFQYARMEDSGEELQVPVILVTDVSPGSGERRTSILAEYKNGAWEMKEGIERS